MIFQLSFSYFDNLSPEKWVAFGTILLAIVTTSSIVFSWRSLKIQAMYGIMPRHAEILRKAAEELRGFIPDIGNYQIQTAVNIKKENILSLLSEGYYGDLIISHTTYYESRSFVMSWVLCEKIHEEYWKNAEMTINKLASNFINELNERGIKLELTKGNSPTEIGYTNELLEVLKRNWKGRLHFNPFAFETDRTEFKKYPDEQKGMYYLKVTPNSPILAYGEETQIEILGEILSHFAFDFENFDSFINDRLSLLVHSLVYSVLRSKIDHYINLKSNTDFFNGKCSFTGFRNPQLKKWFIHKAINRIMRDFSRSYGPLRKKVLDALRSKQNENNDIKGSLLHIIRRKIRIKRRAKEDPVAKEEYQSIDALFVRNHEPKNEMKIESLDVYEKGLMELTNDILKQPKGATGGEINRMIRYWINEQWNYDIEKSTYRKI